VRLGASTFPLSQTQTFRRLQIGTDFFLFNKFLRNAPIDEPTGNDYFLGFEPDIFLNWQITSDVSLAVRYGFFVPQTNNFAVDDIRQFLYTGLTFAF